MAKAKNDVLNDLHAIVADVIKKKLASDDCTAQDIAQAIKFLKDNGVVADPEFSKDLQDISDKIVNIKNLPFPVKVGNGEE